MVNRCEIPQQAAILKSICPTMSEAHSDLTLVLPVVLFLTTIAGWKWAVSSRSNKPTSESDACSSRTTSAGSTLDALIGNTPLIKLNRLSEKTGCDIFVKMESLNPSGTGKDRAVQYMLRQARQHPSYGPGVSIVEGTSGSTGIAFAFQCNAARCEPQPHAHTTSHTTASAATKSDASKASKAMQLYIVMPDDQADEKRALLEKLGATVVITPCCAISNKDHYVNVARRLAEELDSTQRALHAPAGAIFMDQFENVSNYLAHYEGTGPEIWRQMGENRVSNGRENSDNGGVMTGGRRMDAFVMSAGTGGTIAGVSKYLKEQDPSVQIFLADPTGSSLLHKVLYNVCYTPQQSERTVRKHRYDSIVEGVGLDRVTANFTLGLPSINGGYLVPDQEIVEMAHWLLRNEGLFVGSSSALNVAAAVRAAHALRTQRAHSPSTLSSKHNTHSNTHNTNSTTDRSDDSSIDSGSGDRIRVVTVICDNGNRHLSRFWNQQYIESNYKLRWPSTDTIPACLQLFSAAN